MCDEALVLDGLPLVDLAAGVGATGRRLELQLFLLTLLVVFIFLVLQELLVVLLERQRFILVVVLERR